MTSPLDAFLQLGEKIELGTETLDAADIKRFAAKYDPQRFHLDEAEAGRSVFGRLCASGWHTCALWMKHNLAHRQDARGVRWEGPGPRPVFGPSPGFTDLRWLKPAYAGETVTFTRTALSHRAIASRPGWRVLTVLCEAYDSAGDRLVTFQSAVLVQTGP